ncbi:MAG: thiamine phosphate synthase [Planctomycetota bacterium]|nr:thiamine phosphate synthase [Planctomycetota bacterium]
MADGRLTEGGRRAVLLADRQAAHWKHESVLPAHLLWALLAEESQAAELLEIAGVTRLAIEQGDIWNGNGPCRDSTVRLNSESVADEVNEETEDDDALAALTRDVAAVFETVNPVTSSQERAAVERVLFHARRNARSEGRDVEASSLHLLAAVIAEDTHIAAFLFGFGVTQESFKPGPDDDGDSVRPMNVSFEIDQHSESPGERAVVHRILDASANRAREGLRVVEDFVRFSLDDAHLSRLLKSARHQLSSVVQSLDQDSLITSRSTRADVGTRITTSAEMVRESPLAVVKASLKRVQEATRTLEEYSKVLAIPHATPDQSSVVQQLEQLRYELYSIEKAILTTIGSQRRFDSRSVYLLLSVDQCSLDAEHVLREAIAGGVRIVQIREKSMPDRQLLEYARRVRKITRESGTLMIMNDRPDLAMLCEADGVHVGQDELRLHDVRRIAGPDCLIGVSTHSIEQARDAVLDGASYIGVGPVFPSGTKTFDVFTGLDLVREVATEIQLPWFPIGGIDESNVNELVDTGALRVAISGAVCRSDNPRAVAERLVHAVAGSRQS